MNQEFEKSVTNLLSRAAKAKKIPCRKKLKYLHYEMDFGTAKMFVKISFN